MKIKGKFNKNLVNKILKLILTKLIDIKKIYILWTK